MVEQYHLAEKSNQVSLERDRAKMAIQAVRTFHEGIAMQDQAAQKATDDSKKRELIYLNNVISFVEKWAVFVNDKIASPKVVKQILGPDLKSMKAECQQVFKLRQEINPNSVRDYGKLMENY